MWDRVLFPLAIVVTALGFFAHPAMAADVGSMDRNVFYLDQGFIGHPVTLDAFGGGVRVSWDTGDLLAPTRLMVERDAEQPDIIHLTWADPYDVASRGVRVDVPSRCVPDAFTTCTLFRQDGDEWTVASSSRAYGYSIVRISKMISPYMKNGTASWYAYKNCRCAASPDFPKGTHVKVTSQLTGKNTVVRINDWGPERDKFPDRVIDLDKLAFQEFASTGAGLIRVTVQPLTPDDPDYVLADLPMTVPSATTKKTVMNVASKIRSTASTSTWTY